MKKVNLTKPDWKKIFYLSDYVGKFDLNKAKEAQFNFEGNKSYEEGSWEGERKLITASGDKVTEISNNEGTKYFTGWGE